MLPVKPLVEKIESTRRGMLFEIVKLIDQISNGFVRAWHFWFLAIVGFVGLMLAISSGLFIEAAVLFMGFSLAFWIGQAVVDFQSKTPEDSTATEQNVNLLLELLLFAGLSYFAIDTDNSALLVYVGMAIIAGMSAFFVTRKSKPNSEQSTDSTLITYGRWFGIVIGLLLSSPLTVAYIAITTSILRIFLLSRIKT
jgi:hypothetical protein